MDGSSGQAWTVTTRGDRASAASPRSTFVVMLALANLAGFAMRFLLPGIAPVLKQAGAIDNATLGLLLGPALAVPFGLGSLAFGRVSDRGPRHARALVLGGFALVVAATSMMAASPSVTAQLASRALLGLGQAAFLAPAVSLLMAGAAMRDRAAALAAFTMASSFGRGVALVWAGAILSIVAMAGGSDAWRWPALALLVPQAAIAIALLRILPAAPVSTPDRIAAPPAQCWPTLVAMFVIGAVAVATTQASATWYPLFLVERHALSPAQAATMAGAIAMIGAPAAQALGGWLAARNRRIARAPLPTAVAALVVALAPLWTMAAGATPALSAAAAFVAVLASGSAAFLALFAIQATVAPTRRGGVNGAYLAVTTLVGAGLGPWLVGMASTPDPASIGRAMLAVGIAAAAIAVAALVATRHATVAR